MFNPIKKLFTKSADQVFSSLAIMPFSKFNKNWSTADFLSAYQTSLYTNRALNKRAEKVGEIEFVLTKKNGDKAQDNQVLELLAKPNDAFTGAEFWALYQKYYDIFGEVFIQKDVETRMGGKKRVNSLHLLRPDLVTPYFDKVTGRITKIEYRTAEGTTTIQGEEIIYTHNPSPANPLRGESLLQSGIRQIELATQIDEYHSKVLENGGRVEGVFNFKNENLTQNQLREVKDSYQEEYGNAAKSGQPLFLAGNAQYERLGLDPAELAYLDTKKVNLDDIVFLTGVPKTILGMASGETFANADAGIRVFLRETIKPLLTQLTKKLDEDLVDENLILTFVDPTPEDKEDKRKDLEVANNIHALTTNEKREMLGLDPIKDGDSILVPMNLMPMSQPKPEKAVAKSTKIHHPLRDKSTRRTYHALQLKRLDRRQERFQDAIENYFEGQKNRVVEKLNTKSLIDDIFETSLEIKLAKETALPILEQLLKESAEDSKEIAGSDWDFNTTPEIESWMDNKAGVFAEQINTTTFKKLKSEFTESLNAGENRQDLIKRIENTYGDITKSRAATIARTEVHAFTQKGTLEGYKQANMPIKIWVWAPGTLGGVRDSHQSMDGEEVDINASFSNGLEVPGVGSAGEVINCQCFI